MSSVFYVRNKAMRGWDINVNVGKYVLTGLLSDQGGLAKLIEVVLKQILEAHVVEFLWVNSTNTAKSVSGNATIGLSIGEKWGNRGSWLRAHGLGHQA
jgi:hypothetical protein